MLGKQGLPLCGAAGWPGSQLAAPGTHAFSLGGVAKGAGFGDRPRTEDGQQSPMAIYFLITESF